MKHSLGKRIVAVFVALSFLSYTVEAFAQPSQRADAAVKEHNPNKTEVLDERVIKEKFDKLRKSDREAIALDADLVAKGYRKKDKPENHFGTKETYTDEDGEDITVELIVQDYAPAEGTDGAALGQMTVTGRGRSEIYTFALVAPKGKVEEAEEFTVDREAKVIRAHSWWTCMQGQLLSVGIDCATALATCAIEALLAGPFSWAAYLACVARECAISFVVASGCCACNCAWWCGWIKCCRQ